MYVCVVATTRRFYEHDRGMKNVADTSSNKRQVVTRRHVEKITFGQMMWTNCKMFTLLLKFIGIR